MMRLHKEFKQMHELSKLIDNYTKKKTATPQVKASQQSNTSRSNGPVSAETKEKAVKTIERFWHNHKIRETVMRSPYLSYLRMIDEKDERKVLSQVMYGRHQAEMRPNSKYRAINPYIYGRAFYHRGDDLSGIMLNRLLEGFDIWQKDRDEYIYIAVTRLQSLPCEKVIGQKVVEVETNKLANDKNVPIYLIRNDDHSVDLLKIRRANIARNRDISRESRNAMYAALNSSGLLATPWEIALDAKKRIATSKEKSEKELSAVLREIGPIALDADLPDSRDKLLSSDIYKKLLRISRNRRIPTSALAHGLLRMIKDIPAHSSIDADAIKRISLFIDLANTFYTSNYPRYAFCVSSVIHELSLMLALNDDPSFLENGYNNFYNESKTTLSKAFGISFDDLPNSQFICSPAKSGTNAFAITMSLIKNAKTVSNKPPRVKIFKPCYYEFAMLNKTTRSDEADILVISAGPIVNPEGLTPGVDINKFIKREIIDRKKKTPTTIVVDATTALYKNLKLEPEVQKLVDEGMISIIVVESHQKFGLMHSDQAQYGRVFGICSKKSLAADTLATFQHNAKVDYNSQLDMRIGAFISSQCGDILEEIKTRHFSNGEIFRNILTTTSLVSRSIVTHKYMLKNLAELYFLTDTSRKFTQAVKGTTEYRSSFGHFVATCSGVCEQLRLCPDASDEVDTLIQSARIYLSLSYNSVQMIEISRKMLLAKEKLNLNDSIIMLALLNNIIDNPYILKNYTSSQKRQLFGECLKLVDNSLAGRNSYSKVVTLLDELNIDFKNEIIKKYNPRNVGRFIIAHDLLLNNNVQLSPELLRQLANDEKLCLFIAAVKNIATESLLNDVIANRKSLFVNAYDSVSDDDIVKLRLCSNTVKKIEMITGKPISYNILSDLNKNEAAQKALAIILSKNIATPLAYDITLAVLNPSVSEYILNNADSLSTHEITALSILGTRYPDVSHFTPQLTNMKFVGALIQVQQGNDEILSHLSSSPTKRQLAEDYSPVYVKACIDALHNYYANSNKGDKARASLFKSLDKTKHDYCNTALSKDRSYFSKSRRVLLAAVVNSFAALTLGLAHYLHYKHSGRVGFFTNTKSVERIDKQHRELYKIISK